MKTVFLLSFALMTGGVAYEAWHLWRLTPMGWPIWQRLVMSCPAPCSMTMPGACWR
ncbi:MAG: hypothetical protein IJ154_06235 [Bacteroidales bacterium]|nr:hypothetical protein [Bacteroidales bacterium]